MRLRPPRGALALVAAALTSCAGSPDEATAGKQAQPAGAPGERPFVVFAQRRLLIDRLGVPFAPPVTVGSTASPETLRSDAPGIVDVDPTGALVGRRNGRALVRSPANGQVLEVEVHAASVLAVAPARATLRPGGTQQLRLFTGGGGEEVPGEAAEWATNRPDVAIVIGGRVEAGRKPGTATVTVSYGGQVATAQVVVAEHPGPAFAIRPQAPTLRVGEAVTFEALSRRGPVAALWAPKGARLLAQSGPSTFVAVASGRSQVCGEAGGKVACATVTVRRP